MLVHQWVLAHGIGSNSVTPRIGYNWIIYSLTLYKIQAPLIPGLLRCTRFEPILIPWFPIHCLSRMMAAFHTDSCWFPADISRISWLIYPGDQHDQHYIHLQGTTLNNLRQLFKGGGFNWSFSLWITHQICAEKIIAGCGVWSPPPFALGCRGCPVGDPIRCWSLISDVNKQTWLMSTLSRSLSQTKYVYLIYNNKYIYIYNIIIFNYIRRLIW